MQNILAPNTLALQSETKKFIFSCPRNIFYISTCEKITVKIICDLCRSCSFYVIIISLLISVKMIHLLIFKKLTWIYYFPLEKKAQIHKQELV